MGVFLGAMSDTTPPVQFIGGKEVPQAPLREQVKVAFRATGTLFACIRRATYKQTHMSLRRNPCIYSPANGVVIFSHFPPLQSMLLYRQHFYPLPVMLRRLVYVYYSLYSDPNVACAL